MFDLDIEDNIKLTLEVSENYLKNIIADPQDVKNYKMLILTLHNALELTFKFMLQSRNDFMIYDMQNSSSYNNVIKFYKNARKHRNHPTENMESQKVLHTVSFTKAYEILAYLYNIEVFDDKFIFKLNRLGILRNALTHHKATIEYTDIIVLYQLYEECVHLYNSELDNENNAFNRLIHEDDNYGKIILDHELSYEFSKAIEAIKMKLLNEPVVKVLLGHLIQTLNNVNPDIDLNDYEELYEFFCAKKQIVLKDDTPVSKMKEFGFTDEEIEQYKLTNKHKIKQLNNSNKNRSEEISRHFNNLNGTNQSNSSKEFTLKCIYMILESDFIYTRTYYSNDIDIMGGISLSVSCKNLILSKWDRNRDLICEVFKLSQEEYTNLISFDGDYTSNGYDENE